MPDLANAKVNVTYAGQNGDMPSEVDPLASKEQILVWVAESLRAGDISGIPAQTHVDLSNYVVDTPCPPTPERNYPLITVRPKTPYGA